MSSEHGAPHGRPPRAPYTSRTPSAPQPGAGAGPERQEPSWPPCPPGTATGTPASAPGPSPTPAAHDGSAAPYGPSAARVLGLLRLAGHAGSSRSELAECTGLTPQAVSKITARLRADGLVTEAGRRASTGGKPSTVLRLAPGARHAVGLHLDRDQLTAVLVDLSGTLVAEHTARLSLGEDAESVLGAVESAVRGLLAAGLPAAAAAAAAAAATLAPQEPPGTRPEPPFPPPAAAPPGGPDEVRRAAEGEVWSGTGGLARPPEEPDEPAERAAAVEGELWSGTEPAAAPPAGRTHARTPGEGEEQDERAEAEEGPGGAERPADAEAAEGATDAEPPAPPTPPTPPEAREAPTPATPPDAREAPAPPAPPEAPAPPASGAAAGPLPEPEDADALAAAGPRAGGGAPWGSVVGIGVAAPGPLDPGRGVLHRVTGHPEWSGFPLRDALAERLGLPVVVDKDTNAAAAGLVQRDDDSFAYVHLGTGLGAGLVLGGRVHRGGRGGAGEFGHQVLQMDGPQCRCGRRGCAEVLCLDAVRDGDTAEAARVLGTAAANLVSLLGIDRVLLGGRTVLAEPDAYVAGVGTVVDAVAAAATGAPPEPGPGDAPGRVRVELAPGGARAVANGAAQLVLAPLFGRAAEEV